MNTLQAIEALALMAVITAALRSLPFLVFGGKRETPQIITYLGEVLPYSIMAMLVIYCLKGISFATVAGYLPMILASAVVILLHIWRRNTLLSIIAGTLSYMFLVQFIFV